MEQQISSAVATELWAVDPAEPYSRELYDALAHCMLSVAAEAVFLRVHDGYVEVFLKSRAHDDTAYPGMLHVPGTVIRSSDVDGAKTFRNAINRVAMSECDVEVEDILYVDEHFKREPRGAFYCRVFLVRTIGEPTGGQWCRADRLPADVIEEHANLVIPVAVRRFKERFNID